MAKKFKKYCCLILVTVWLSGLSACVSLIPERFESNLKFLAAYGYVEYNFRGNVVVADAALNVISNKVSQSEADKKLKEIEQTILDDDKSAMGERQFRSLRYIGDNRFAADQQVKSSFMEDLSFFQAENSPFFVEIVEGELSADPKYFGEYTIRAFLVDDVMRDKMKRLKLRQQGTFSVETDCRVMAHNAHTVGRNGRNYVYTWRMEGKLNAPAMITLRAQNPGTTRF